MKIVKEPAFFPGFGECFIYTFDTEDEKQEFLDRVGGHPTPGQELSVIVTVASIEADQRTRKPTPI